MIIVIADDITGAAELAGIGLRYGLRVKLAAKAEKNDHTDLLVLYSNTRSMNKAQAVETMRHLTIEARMLDPLLVYKKTDSVLRGHVLAELTVQMETLDLNKALLVPVNPGLGRTIENGNYYINGQPLHETSFSGDPEFPARTAVVKELLAGEATGVSVKNPGSQLSNGINVGEAKTKEDVQQWAAYQENILLAGGGFFFNVLLATKYQLAKESIDTNLHYPALFVSGTAFLKDSADLRGLETAVSFMPAKLFNDEEIHDVVVNGWSDQIVSVINNQHKAYVAIGGNEKGNPEFLRMKMAAVVKKVIDKVQIHELIIEGGATAFSVMEALDWKRFTPQSELSFGVVKLKVDGANDIFLTIKPGSYPWPPSWNFKN